MRGVRRIVPPGRSGSGGGGGGQGHRNRARVGASEPYILDRLLLPRLQQYSYNNQVSNIDATVDYLRTNYREYRRKQQGPFRKLVVKAVYELRKQIRDPVAGGPEEEREHRSQRRRRDEIEDENLRSREEQHIMRFRSDNSGQHNGELEAESLDNSSENSDGVESEGMSDDGREEDGRNGAGKGNLRESTGKAVVVQGRNFLTVDRRVGQRREGKEKETSDSEEELAFDGMEEEKPAFNLLNSSLRATYNGRPALILESSSGVDKTGFTGSSSLFKFPSVPKGYHENGGPVQGECSSRLGGGGSNVMGEDARPAFAEPSVVAEAARAAYSRKRSQKGPVIDQETREAFGKGFANVMAADKDLYRGSPPAQSSGRLPQTQSMTKEFHSSSRSTSTPLPRLRVDQKASEVPLRLERVESGVGTYDGEQVTNKIRERENGKVRSSKRRKSKDGRQNGMSDIAAQEKPLSSSNANPKNVSFKDLGGIDDTLEIIRENIEYPLAHPELYEHLGVQPPRGVLLHGPPGCGKTMLANAIAVETGVPFLKISAPEVVSGMSGESEAKVRALFADAVRVAPSIIFIDEIDAITPKRETAQREMERRIVAQLLTCMDDLSLPLSEKDGGSVGVTKKRPRHVVVIGATNRPDALDPALRRAGRFDREIALGIPDEQARSRILSILAQKLRLEGSFDFKQIAKRTPGFVGADLAALIKEAAAVAVKRIFISRDPRVSAPPSSDSKNIPNGTWDSKKLMAPYKGTSENSRIFEAAPIRLEDRSTQGVLRGASSSSPESASVCKDLDPLGKDQEHWRRPWTQNEMELLSITMQDFEVAVAKVQPSAKREGFATIPDVTWDDVGSLGPVREELELSISRPIKHPEEYQALGLDMATGVLLYGPPGCGKTLVAKAIANDAGANFISVKGPELLNKYFGESERAVRQLFTRARASAPCVLFFDEMDAMAPKRGNDGNAAAERVVNQLLTEMDGLESRRSIYIIAATNRPDMIDPALMRPGRLGKLLFVPLPDPQGRGSILKALVRKVPLAPDVDVVSIGRSSRCENFSGADLASLIREACLTSIQERASKSSGSLTSAASHSSTPIVSYEHFNAAFTKVCPSVSSKDRDRYDLLCKKLGQARGNINTDQEADR